MTQFAAAGAEIAPNAEAALGDADIVLTVRRPAAAVLGALKKGAIVVGQLDPYRDRRPQALAASRRQRLRHGADAAHHPRPVDGRAVLAGQSRRLQGGDRRRGRISAAPFR